MNLDAIVVAGQPAWLPNERATNLDALHVHDFPLIGTFDLGKSRILFACLTGATSTTNVWGYVELPESSRPVLEAMDFESSAALELWAHEQAAGQGVALAWVKDGHVVHWSVERVGESEVLLDACVRFMDLEIAIHRSSKAHEPPAVLKHEAAQARADATLSVLEPGVLEPA